MAGWHRENIECMDDMLTMNTTAQPDAQPFLLGLKGAYEGYEIPVLSTGILIGRDSGVCHLIFADTPEVSRYHCRVFYDKWTGYFVVTDLKSKNGVYQEDGRRVPPGEKIALAPGQIFKLCGDLIIFQAAVKGGMGT